MHYIYDGGCTRTNVDIYIECNGQWFITAAWRYYCLRLPSPALVCTAQRKRELRLSAALAELEAAGLVGSEPDLYLLPHPSLARQPVAGSLAGPY